MTGFKLSRISTIAGATCLLATGCFQLSDLTTEGTRAASQAPTAVAAVDPDQPRARGKLPEQRLLAATSVPVEIEAAGRTPDADHPAAAVIDRLGQKTMAILSDASLTQAERQNFFQDLLADNIDIPMLARFLAGRHWRRASPEQRQAYVSAFTDFMLQVFARQLGGAQLDAFDVLGSKPVGRKDIVVLTRLHRGGKLIRVDWRLRRRDDRFRVIDITAEGISMALTRRQEFAAIIQASGGRFDGLIIKLRQFASKAS